VTVAVHVCADATMRARTREAEHSSVENDSTARIILKFRILKF
jgi:hypothetical protein